MAAATSAPAARVPSSVLPSEGAYSRIMQKVGIFNALFGKKETLPILEDWGRTCALFSVYKEPFESLQKEVAEWNPEHDMAKKIKALWGVIFGYLNNPSVDRRHEVLADLFLVEKYSSFYSKEELRRRIESPSSHWAPSQMPIEIQWVPAPQGAASPPVAKVMGIDGEQAILLVNLRRLETFARDGLCGILQTAVQSWVNQAKAHVQVSLAIALPILDVSVGGNEELLTNLFLLEEFARQQLLGDFANKIARWVKNIRTSVEDATQGDQTGVIVVKESE